ncbi:hypothetical protein V1519DRAFT_453098 [Lipomyces tetrasporus]
MAVLLLATCMLAVATTHYQTTGPMGLEIDRFDKLTALLCCCYRCGFLDNIGLPSIYHMGLDWRLSMLDQST